MGVGEVVQGPVLRTDVVGDADGTPLTPPQVRHFVIPRKDYEIVEDITVDKFPRKADGFAYEADGFVKAWNARDTFDPQRPLGPWLFTIARHCALDIVRRDRRADDVEPTWFDSRDGDADDPAASAERAWTLWEVRRAIDTLPQGERDVVRLGSLAGLSHPEIAEQLGIPIGTVKSRSNRAHQRLAAALEHVHGANHDALSGVEHDSGRRHGT